MTQPAQRGRTKKQRDYMKFYEQETGFEFIDDISFGETFAERVKKNVRWYEDHVSDVHARISTKAGEFYD